MRSTKYLNISKDLLFITLATIAIAFLIWLPFILKLDNFYGLNFSQGMDTIYRNYDGIEYIVIAKTLYNPELMGQFPIQLSNEYYAAHFPGYSLLILVFAPLLGFLKSMLFVALLSTIASAIAFYFLVKDFQLTKSPLLLSLIFLILPARWMVIHSVGSSEPMFIFFTIMTIYTFMKFEITQSKIFIWLTGGFGALAQITRPPGILIFVALGIFIIWKLFTEHRKNFFSGFVKSITTYYPLLLIPCSLLGIFSWFHLAYNDFFAYFHSGDNIHLSFPPFQVFNKSQSWVGDIWLEDIVMTIMFGFLGGFLLFTKGLKVMSAFVLTYLVATIFVAHRDISRYVLPIFPFVLIAFEKVLTSKEFRLVLIIVALALYLYTQNFLIHNTAPIGDLSLFN